MNWGRTAAAALVGAAVGSLPPLAGDRRALDALAFAAAPLMRPATADIALVLLDDHTHAHPAFAAPRVEWSVPMAALLTRLLDAGAAVVVVDVVFARADRVSPEWLRALRAGAHGGRVVLAVAPGDPPLAPDPAQVMAAGGRAALAAASLRRGVDGVVRVARAVDGELPTLGAAAAARVGAEVWGPVPVATRTDALVAWSAAAVLDAAPDALREAFAGRAVFVGAWVMHDDRHRSALSALPAYARTVNVIGPRGAASVVVDEYAPGVLLHAAAAAGWLGASHRPPARADDFAAAVVGSLSGALLAPTLAAAAVFVAIAVAVVAYAAGAVLPAAAFIAALAAALAARAASTVLRAAWRYAAALPAPFRARPDAAVVRRVTACFVDIESFTAATETAHPESVAGPLGDALARFAALAERERGFVDKYLGDGMMVVFGLDGAVDAPARAVRAAASIAAECARLRPINGSPVRVRIGLATGDARIGALGPGERVHFTAVGDCVNVAARLEQLTRALGARVLADAATRDAAGGEWWRDRGSQVLRGRRRPVRVYELRLSERPV